MKNGNEVQVVDRHKLVVNLLAETRQADIF